MNEIQKGNADLPKIKVWNGKRVVTFRDIDEVHQRANGTASRNFKTNKKHFIEGVDYFLITREDFNGRNSSIGENIGNVPPKGLTLVTESGYLMITKSFTDDLSWDVQRQLVNSYFQAQAEPQQQPLPESSPNWYELDATPPKVPIFKSWYKRNKGRIYRLCKRAHADTSELYHYILKRIGECYDLDAANAIYEQETGHAPAYAMDIVEYFPELGKEADKFLDRLENL